MAPSHFYEGDPPNWEGPSCRNQNDGSAGNDEWSGVGCNSRSRSDGCV